MIFFKPGDGAAEGLAAVGDFALSGHVEFGGGFVELGEEKEGVVAEAVGAAGGAEHGAADVVDEDGEVGGGEGEGHGAYELGVSLLVGNGFQLGKYFGVVGGVNGVAIAAPPIGIGVAGAEDAGAAVEGVDGEAGVIGEGEGVGVGREVAGFFGGVADEGGTVFDAIGVGWKIGQRENGKGIGEAGAGKFVVDFFDLAGVGGGDEKVHGISDFRFSMGELAAGFIFA